jgi:hypothetical protein
MVGCPRWNRDESIHGNGVEVSSTGHDRPRRRTGIRTLRLVDFILASL